MALPFHTTSNISKQDPIFKNSYDVVFIKKTGEYKNLSVEKFNIVDDVIFCMIQDDAKLSYSIIKDSKILLISYYEKTGYVIKCDILKVDNLSYKSEFGWSNSDISNIETSYKILKYDTISGDDLLLKDGIIKSILREDKIDSLLD